MNFKKFLIISLIALVAIFLNAKLALAKRGCCSYHSGVCGCSQGRQVCCDGSLSPSCICDVFPPLKSPESICIPEQSPIKKVEKQSSPEATPSITSLNGKKESSNWFLITLLLGGLGLIGYKIKKFYEKRNQEKIK